MKSICVIILYFGELPWYFPYFINSVKFNPTVDYYFISDIFIKESLPDNFRTLRKSIMEINEVASSTLGFATRIENAYKLCDFKPAYGFLFPEIIKDYDFWGYSDIDLVYGDIRVFFTDGLLQNHDIISARHDYLTGSFCLYRNTPKMNRLFMESRDYRKVFSSAIHYCFDECNFLFSELQNGASIFDFPENIQSMTYVVRKAEAEGKLRAFFDFIIVEGTPGRIKWEKGKIIYKQRYEAMFYHLIKFKKECERPRLLKPIPDTFFFSPARIYK